MRICPVRLDEFMLEQRRKLRQLFRDAETAKQRFGDLEEWITALAKSGLVDGQVVLGNKVLSMSYQPNEGGSDTGPCYQAAITIPEGMGAIRMDSEEWQRLQSIPEGLESNARSHFVPLLQCRPVVQQWLLSQIDVLVEKLIKLLPPPMQPSQPFATCPSISTQVFINGQRSR